MILKDKVAVVTGGSSGIGAATVRMLAHEGASVVICYNKGLERARALLDELPKAPHRIQHLAVEDSSSVRRAADEIGNAYGRAHILVNSAGVTRPIPHGRDPGVIRRYDPERSSFGRRILGPNGLRRHYRAQARPDARGAA